MTTQLLVVPSTAAFITDDAGHATRQFQFFRSEEHTSELQSH